MLAKLNIDFYLVTLQFLLFLTPPRTIDATYWPTQSMHRVYTRQQLLNNFYNQSSLLASLTPASSSSSSSTLLLNEVQDGQPQYQQARHRIPTQPVSMCQRGLDPVTCSPPLINLARQASIEASSTCGGSICTAADKDCVKCTEAMSVTQLTSHSLYNQTCWASGRIVGDEAVNISLSLGKRFEVDYLSLQPCPLYGSLPDSIALFRSSDFGRQWRPWHYFSVDCYRAFGLPTSIIDDQSGEVNNELRCSLLNKSTNVITFRTVSTNPGRSRPSTPIFNDWVTLTDLRISMMRLPVNNGYSELNEHRSKRSSLDRSQLHRTRQYHRPYGRRYQRAFNYRRQLRIQHPALDDQALTRFPGIPASLSSSTTYRSTRSLTSEKKSSTSDSPLSKPTDDERREDRLANSDFYSLTNLVVGGRCKCNGHASQCSVGLDGRLRCECQHNTEGDDCERCREGYQDQPWTRALIGRASSCKKCNCNLHSNECHFSNEFYLISNRVSGGECHNCRHNTTGRNCQLCAEGFHRDWTIPLSHEKACLPCRCNQIGSLDKHHCNRDSGQCQCKQGVTGLTCDRCSPGYHHTQSPITPCSKELPTRSVALAHAPNDLNCPPCDPMAKARLNVNKFCRKFAIFQATFTSRELHSQWIRFEANVSRVWRLAANADGDLDGIGDRVEQLFLPGMQQQLRVGIEDSSSTINNYPSQWMLQPPTPNLVPVWLKLNHLQCKCLHIELGIVYLVITDYAWHEDVMAVASNNNGRSRQKELAFTIDTAVLPWRSGWDRRLDKIQRLSEARCGHSLASPSSSRRTRFDHLEAPSRRLRRHRLRHPSSAYNHRMPSSVRRRRARFGRYAPHHSNSYPYYPNHHQQSGLRDHPETHRAAGFGRFAN